MTYIKKKKNNILRHKLKRTTTVQHLYSEIINHFGNKL